VSSFHTPSAAMGRGICPHCPTRSPQLHFDDAAHRHQGRPVRAAAPCGCGRRGASPLSSFAFWGGDAPARGQGVRPGSGEDAAPFGFAQGRPRVQAKTPSRSSRPLRNKRFGGDLRDGTRTC